MISKLFRQLRNSFQKANDPERKFTMRVKCTCGQEETWCTMRYRIFGPGVMEQSAKALLRCGKTKRQIDALRRIKEQMNTQKPLAPLTVERAAIRDHDGKVYHVPAPGRHHNVIKLMANSGCKIPITGEQGFLLSDGRFVNRKVAKVIAKDAMQLLPRASKKSELFSEDVW